MASEATSISLHAVLMLAGVALLALLPLLPAYAVLVAAESDTAISGFSLEPVQSFDVPGGSIVVDSDLVDDGSIVSLIYAEGVFKVALYSDGSLVWLALVEAPEGWRSVEALSIGVVGDYVVVYVRGKTVYGEMLGLYRLYLESGEPLGFTDQYVIGKSTLVYGAYHSGGYIVAYGAYYSGGERSWDPAAFLIDPLSASVSEVFIVENLGDSRAFDSEIFQGNMCIVYDTESLEGFTVTCIDLATRAVVLEQSLGGGGARSAGLESLGSCLAAWAGGRGFYTRGPLPGQGFEPLEGLDSVYGIAGIAVEEDVLIAGGSLGGKPAIALYVGCSQGQRLDMIGSITIDIEGSVVSMWSEEVYVALYVVSRNGSSAIGAYRVAPIYDFQNPGATDNVEESVETGTEARETTDPQPGAAAGPQGLVESVQRYLSTPMATAVLAALTVLLAIVAYKVGRSRNG